MPLLPLSQYRTFVVVDCETTGLDAQADRLVEVAAVRFVDGRPTAVYESLVNPGMPIPPTASGIHFITDDHVAHAPDPETVLELIAEFAGNDDVVIAHNAPFDSGFITSIDKGRWICSLRAARHTWPEAPDYKNQTLRFWLKIRDPLLEGIGAHRARGDALATGFIFDRALQIYAESHPGTVIADFREYVASPIFPSRFDYGRQHRGAFIENIPVTYLQWVLRDAAEPEGQRRMNVDPDTIAAIIAGLDRRYAAA